MEIIKEGCDRMPLDRISQYEKAILNSVKPELLQALKSNLSLLLIFSYLIPFLSHTICTPLLRTTELERLAIIVKHDWNKLPRGS
jgi:hypothetical protein